MRGELRLPEIPPPDERARAEAAAHHGRLTKPAGALGRLEDLAIWAAGVRRHPRPKLQRSVIVLAAADHGVATRGVSAYPPDVTAQMLANFIAGGAAVNVLASHAGAEVHVVDAGVRNSAPDAAAHVAKLREGSDDMARGPAMSRDEAAALVERGIACAREHCAGADAVGLGDMGIGNTTTAAALTSALTGAAPAQTVGRGTGVDDARYALKLGAVRDALALHAPSGADPLGALACVGGCEIAFLAGVAIGSAAASLPVVLDGYPTTAAALVATALSPGVADYLLAGHVSAEPGHRIALAQLGLEPLLDLRMRLGEGTGAALALSLLRAALRIPHEMATFASAGVSTAAAELRPES
jgi:nicotinate-nucleotide--dimethylbenzimidazole phosphoribosyltransferase